MISKSSPNFYPLKHSIGGAIGSPNSISYKSLTNKVYAITANLHFAEKSRLMIFSDYQHLYPNFFHGINISQLIKVTAYWGLGFFILTSLPKTCLGLRIPLGVEWQSQSPLSVFFEIAPGLSVTPEIASYVTTSQLGVRYWF